MSGIIAGGGLASLGAGAAAGGGGLFAGASAWAPAALGLAGTGVKAAGQSKGGQANSGMYAYQAAIARRNAAIQRMRADRAEQAGIAGADLESLRGANTMGSVKAKQAASGVLVNEGSNVDVRADVAKANKFNATNVLRNAELTAWGYRRAADNADTQAKLYDAGAIGAGQTGGAVAGTLLEGASAAPWGWLKGLGDGKSGDTSYIVPGDASATISNGIV